MVDKIRRLILENISGVAARLLVLGYRALYFTNAVHAVFKFKIKCAAALAPVHTNILVFVRISVEPGETTGFGFAVAQFFVFENLLGHVSTTGGLRLSVGH